MFERLMNNTIALQMISADIDNSGMIAMMIGMEIPESERYLGGKVHG